MAKKKKISKVKAAKKGKATKKKQAVKKRSSAKKHSAKKAAKKKVAKKKAVAKKRSVKKIAKKKPVAKKAAKKAIKKKPVVKKAPAKKGAAKKIVHTKPAVHKAEHTEVKTPKPVMQDVQKEVVQQEANHSGNHRESFVPHVTGLKVGDEAPYFSGSDQHGNLVSLNDFHGKTLILYFYPKDDTDGCTAESCSLRDEYEYISTQNAVVVGVSADDVESHKHFAEKFNLPFSLIADTNMDMIKAYDVWGQKRLFDKIYDGIVRTTFIIKDGKIARVITSVNTKNHGKQVMEA